MGSEPAAGMLGQQHAPTWPPGWYRLRCPAGGETSCADSPGVQIVHLSIAEAAADPSAPDTTHVRHGGPRLAANWHCLRQWEWVVSQARGQPHCTVKAGP